MSERWTPDSKIEGKTGTSEIYVNRPFEELERLCPLERTAILADTKVYSLYKNRFPRARTMELPVGEGFKTLDNARDIMTGFLQAGLDRHCFVVAVGGGMITDLVGFIASTFMRGLPFGFVPTTLVAQGDAAIGGKNAVNLSRYKNIVGTVTQPRFVLIDPAFLHTLPKAELRCGLTEMIKHGLVADAAFFEKIEKNHDDILRLKPGVIEEALKDSVRIKAEIVQRDEREEGERKKLNFGHTVGHALEKTAGLPHGEAVALGMIAAARLSVERGMLSGEDFERIRGLIEVIGLPTTVKVEAEPLMDALAKDKKRNRDTVDFVLLDGPGRAEVVPIGIDELKGLAQVLR